MRRRPRRPAVLVATAAIVVGAAGCGQPRSQPARRPPATAISTTPATAPGRPGAVPGFPGVPEPTGPTTVVDGAPMGYRHDVAGAKAAAVCFTRLNQSLVQMDEAAVVAAWRAMSAEGSAEALVADVRTRLGQLRRTWPAGTLSYRVAPLAARAVEESPDHATVDVWYVGVVAGRNLATYEEWVTDTYHLVWEREDWRVAAFADAPGPRPEPGGQEPASAPEIEGFLAGFEAVP